MTKRYYKEIDILLKPMKHNNFMGESIPNHV